MTLAAVSDRLLEIAETFDTAGSIEQLCNRFHVAVSAVGDFHYALGRFQPLVQRDQGIIAVRYPDAWLQHYKSKGYIDIDPTIDSITKRSMPYVWDQFSDLDIQRQQLFDDLRDFGVAGGLTVPIHMADGTTFVASFAMQDSDISRRFRSLLSLISTQFVERYAMLSEKPRPTVKLSVREEDCLSWTARGKSAWEIGVLLGISESTVNFHIKNACAKLGSHGRMLGVVKAITLGLISP